MKRMAAISAAVLCALSCGGPRTQGSVALLAPQRPSGEMPALIEQYQADRNALERAYNVPFATRRRDRMARFYDGWEKTLAAVDFAALPQEGRVDYLLFKNQLRSDRDALDRKPKVDDAARPLVPFADLVAGLEEARRAFEAVDGEKAAGRLVELARLDTAAVTLAPRRSDELNLRIIGRLVERIVLVSDAEMHDAARWLWQEAGVAAELSGAAAVAALLAGHYQPRSGERVCAVVCGAGTDGIG